MLSIKEEHGRLQRAQEFQLRQKYHWYILAHQNVKKLDANNYTTSMKGLKYKLSHKRAEKEKWNASNYSQKKRLIQILKELIVQLEGEMIETARQI